MCNTINISTVSARSSTNALIATSPRCTMNRSKQPWTRSNTTSSATKPMLIQHSRVLRRHPLSIKRTQRRVDSSRIDSVLKKTKKLMTMVKSQIEITILSPMSIKGPSLIEGWARWTTMTQASTLPPRPLDQTKPTWWCSHSTKAVTRTRISTWCRPSPTETTQTWSQSRTPDLCSTLSSSSNFNNNNKNQMDKNRLNYTKPTWSYNRNNSNRINSISSR